MKKSLARAFIQVLALLTGLAIATTWRDRHNLLVHFPQWQSTRADVAPDLFVRDPSALGGESLNLASGSGPQEVLFDHAWPTAPRVAFQTHVEAGEIDLELRPADATARTLVLRLSSRPSRPSAWLEMDGTGRFVARTPLPLELPMGRRVPILVEARQGQWVPSVDGKEGPAHAVPPGAVHLLFRGDSDSGHLRLEQLVLGEGNGSLPIQFQGDMPWIIFLAATVLASLLYVAVEALSTPRIAVVFSGIFFLTLCALLALYRGVSPTRPSATAAREAALTRIHDLPNPTQPLLLWLGGSSAAGESNAGEDKSVFGRLRAALGPGSRLAWANALAPGSHAGDQLELLTAATGRGKVALVVFSPSPAEAKGRTFAVKLSALARAAKTAGARFVIVAPPVDPAREAEFHASADALRKVAGDLGADLLDANPALIAHADDGFLWWSPTLPREVGARIAADALAPAFLAEIERAR